MIKLFPFLFFGLIACTNEFKKAEAQFAKGDFEEARRNYLLVDSSDNEYSYALQRLSEIDSIQTLNNFNWGKASYLKGDYKKANKLFLQIPERYEIFPQAQKFLVKIDSIEELKRTENEKLERAENILNVKLQQTKRDEELKAEKRAKEKIQKLLNELLAFKDRSDFHKYGFGEGYKYNRWLKDVQNLKNTHEEEILLKKGFVPGDLEMLGLEYVESKGRETEYSAWAKKTIRDGLKK
jgi:tetratricopeptide (TPR) repeat protein